MQPFNINKIWLKKKKKNLTSPIWSKISICSEVFRCLNPNMTISNKQCWYCIFHHLAQYIVTIVIWLRLCEVFAPIEGTSDLLKMFVEASVGCWLIYSITPWGAKVSFSKRVLALSTQRQISILMFFHAEKTSRTFFSIVGPGVEWENVVIQSLRWSWLYSPL